MRKHLLLAALAVDATEGGAVTTLRGEILRGAVALGAIVAWCLVALWIAG